MHEPAINAAYTKERHTLRACERPWAPCTLQNRQKYGMSVRHSHEERMAGVCVYPVLQGLFAGLISAFISLAWLCSCLLRCYTDALVSRCEKYSPGTLDQLLAQGLALCISLITSVAVGMTAAWRSCVEGNSAEPKP